MWALFKVTIAQDDRVLGSVLYRSDATPIRPLDWRDGARQRTYQYETVTYQGKTHD